MESKLTEIVSDGKTFRMHNPSSYIVGDYSIFCEQYFEEPVISGDYNMAVTPTACTIGGIPVIDDF